MPSIKTLQDQAFKKYVEYHMRGKTVKAMLPSTRNARRTANKYKENVYI
jgi:hypothetical protein